MAQQRGEGMNDATRYRPKAWWKVIEPRDRKSEGGIIWFDVTPVPAS